VAEHPVVLDLGRAAQLLARLQVPSMFDTIVPTRLTY